MSKRVLLTPDSLATPCSALSKSELQSTRVAMFDRFENLQLNHSLATFHHLGSVASNDLLPGEPEAAGWTPAMASIVCASRGFLSTSSVFFESAILLLSCKLRLPDGPVPPHSSEVLSDLLLVLCSKLRS